MKERQEMVEEKQPQQRMLGLVHATVIIVVVLQSNHNHIYTGSLSTGTSTAATEPQVSAGETSISQQTVGLLCDSLLC